MFGVLLIAYPELLGAKKMDTDDHIPNTTSSRIQGYAYGIICVAFASLDSMSPFYPTITQVLVDILHTVQVSSPVVSQIEQLRCR